MIRVIFIDGTTKRFAAVKYEIVQGMIYIKDSSGEMVALIAQPELRCIEKESESQPPAE